MENLWNIFRTPNYYCDIKVMQKSCFIAIIKTVKLYLNKEKNKFKETW